MTRPVLRSEAHLSADRRTALRLGGGYPRTWHGGAALHAALWGAGLVLAVLALSAWFAR